MKKSGFRGTQISDNVVRLIEMKDLPGRNSIGDSGLRDQDLPVLIELLNTNPRITWLDLCGNNIGNQGAILLAKGLKYIKKLDLDSTDIGNSPEMAKALAISNIERLSLTHTSLNNDDARILVKNSRQSYLNIRSNWWVDETWYELADLKAAKNAAIKEKAKGADPVFAASTGESSPKRPKAGKISPLNSDDTIEKPFDPKTSL
jgi:hypothetical protein